MFPPFAYVSSRDKMDSSKIHRPMYVAATLRLRNSVNNIWFINIRLFRRCRSHSMVRILFKKLQFSIWSEFNVSML